MWAGTGQTRPLPGPADTGDTASQLLAPARGGGPGAAERVSDDMAEKRLAPAVVFLHGNVVSHGGFITS